MQRKTLTIIAVLASTAALAQADLIDAFADYNTIWEQGVSGLRSSYGADTRTNQAVTGPITGSELAEFESDRVSYPSGVGTHPSPGGEIGSHFDEGALGYRVDDGNLVIQVASGMDPLTGYYHSQYRKWYGQGDMFLDVQDSTGVRHFALLNAWAHSESGDPRAYNGNHFNSARSFHLPDDDSREGNLVQLVENRDVALAGGPGAYRSNRAPTGLDTRIFAKDGIDLGFMDLELETIVGANQNWYLQRWTVPLATLSADPEFDVGLHIATTCGNDQIGTTGRSIPEPCTLLLIAAGLAMQRRR